MAEVVKTEEKVENGFSTEKRAGGFVGTGIKFAVDKASHRADRRAVALV
jgi:hypothetical protein